MTYYGTQHTCKNNGNHYHQRFKATAAKKPFHYLTLFIKTKQVYFKTNTCSVYHTIERILCYLNRHTRLCGNKLIETAEKSAATGKSNTSFYDIRRKLRRSSVESISYGVENFVNGNCKSLTNLLTCYFNRLGKTVNKISTLYLHSRLALVRICGA